MKREGLKRLSTPFKLIPVQRSVVSSGPTAAQIQKANVFFNSCESWLSDVVTDAKNVNVNDGKRPIGNNRPPKPRVMLPEVMIIGRSNVGKSSLITALMSPLDGKHHPTSKKDLARTSSRAGFTQGLHFYNCGRKMRIVDTPGYGHGSVQRHGNLVLNYLQAQHNLKRIYVLVDGYTDITPLDEAIFTLLVGTGVPWNIVLTKLDKHIKKVGETVTKGVVKQFVTKDDTDRINGVVASTLDRVRLMSSTPDSEGGNGTVLEEVFGTCAHKRLNYMGIPELRASILQTCELV